MHRCMMPQIGLTDGCVTQKMTDKQTPPQIRENRVSPIINGGFIADFFAFSRLVFRRFGNDGGMRIAASLSYTSLLAIVPLGTIAFAILKAFPVFDSIRDRLQGLVFDAFLPETISNVQEHFSNFVGKAGGLTAIGIVALALVAVMLLATIEAALNDIFRVKSKRAFVPRMMMFWAVLTMGPMLMGASLSLATYLFAITKMTDVSNLSGIGWLMTKSVPTVLAIFAFSVFYAIVPYRPVKVFHALIGGISAGLLFALVRKGFAFYVEAFPAYQTLYGALSVIPIFLIWMYLSWAVVLIGAEVTASMPEWGRKGEKGSLLSLSPAGRLVIALKLLEVLWRQSRGELADTDVESAVSHSDKAGSDVFAEMLDALRQAGLVALSDDEKWILCRDLSLLTLAQLSYGLGLAPNANDIVDDSDGWAERLKSALDSSADGWNRGVASLFLG